MELVHTATPQTESSCFPFEGCEKRLFIHFEGNNDLCTIPKIKWIENIGDCTL